MNIIIVGAGEIGRHMALSLSREQHAIVVIEADERVATELDNKIDARVMNADGASVNTLLEAGVAECDLFMALTSHNNINLVSSSMAKALGAAQVICRVHPGLQREEFLFDFRSHFGIDYLFSSERLAAVELAKFVRNPHSIFVEEIARGNIELQQVKVARNNGMTGKPLREMDFPPRVRVGAILRGEESIIPGAEDVLESGDVVTLFGDPNRLHEVAWKLQENGGGREPETNVVIFGGGEYGFSLAQSMESWNCRVRIFESDPDRCEYLTESLANAVILNADATSLAELKEENVGQADFFIAVTEVDEDNVMTCIQAQSLGTRNCLTLIHRADYADAMTRFGERLGIRAAISPREATRRDLMRFVTSDRFHLVRRLHAGELLEAAVMEGSVAAGKKVKEVKWPDNCVLMALLHGIRAVAPAADDEIAAGDHLYALVAPKAKKPFLKLVGG
ncbi:MAG: Trk system potassium transporter TrkA [Verrucomicrobiae bacterium]|nr:Trk system potassium transporter TrkA [Verrucomicrobiae bacterium]